MTGDYKQLSIDSLPDPTNATEVFAFAMTFNGYEYYGSSAASAEAARQKVRASLVDLRNELFFSARASRHSDSSFYLNTYLELLPLFQKMIKAKL